MQSLMAPAFDYSRSSVSVQSIITECSTEGGLMCQPNMSEMPLVHVATNQVACAEMVRTMV